jgi:hypothetical protein
MSEVLMDRLESRCLCASATLIRQLSRFDHGAFDADIVASVGQQFFFGATTGKNDQMQLWTTDGTYHGTFELGQVDPGSTLIAGKSVVFFLSENNGSPQVWQSDGTVKGTYALTDLSNLYFNHDVSILGALGDTAIFEYDKSNDKNAIYAG